VNNIKIPLLIIQAKDDPVVEYNGIPKNLSSENQTIVAITQSGGHIGWIEGIFNLRRWYIKPVLEFLNTVESR
jgi:predicted alpha/beta-fold hydrolase